MHRGERFGAGWTLPDPRSQRHPRTPWRKTEFGAQLLELQRQLFGHWHRYKDGTTDWPGLQQRCRPIRQAFEATLQRVVELGCQRGGRTPWAKTVRTAQQILQVADALWTFLEIEGIEPTNNAAVDEVFSTGVRALCQSVIQHTCVKRAG